MHRRLRVLVIDDQSEALALFRAMLTAEGFDVVEAGDALSGLRAAYQSHPDAILLDVMMPHMDGFEACARLREMTNVPIIFVTAKATIEDTVRGFSAGGDDYITKPFDCSELISRLMACLRRAGQEADEGVDMVFASDSVALDCSRHELMMEKRTVSLTPNEFEVLRLLMRHAGRALSRDAILTRVWGPERIGDPDLVKQYIYRLRQKLEPEPDSPRHLHTIRGIGYYFDADDVL